MEIALLSKRQVAVFQAPPITSAKGHCSQDWHGKQMWTGNIRVTMRDSKVCSIQLVNEDNSLFAQSVLTDGASYDSQVQRAYDSSRAFGLLLVSDQGQKAVVGVIFPERNDSFDFFAALEEFRKAYRVEMGLDQHFKVRKDADQVDLSLKEGEMISLNMPGMEDGETSSAPPKKKGGLKKLAPPPGFKKPVAQAPKEDLMAVA